MILLLLTAAAYFYFHWQYFTLVKKLKEQPCRRIWLVFLGFAINYLFFILCSVLEDVYKRQRIQRARCAIFPETASCTKSLC